MAKILNLRQNHKRAKEQITNRRISNTATSAKTPEINAEPEQPRRLTWEAPSFPYNPQKKYLTLAVTALIATAGGILMLGGDLLTSVLLILSSLVLIINSTKKPEPTEVIIDQRGIVIGESSYHYKDLRSFWINYEPGELKELSLESRRWFMPYTKISIEESDPLQIRSYLIRFIPEKEHERSLIEIISRKMGIQ